MLRLWSVPLPFASRSPIPDSRQRHTQLRAFALPVRYTSAEHKADMCPSVHGSITIRDSRPDTVGHRGVYKYVWLQGWEGLIVFPSHVFRNLPVRSTRGVSPCTSFLFFNSPSHPCLRSRWLGPRSIIFARTPLDTHPFHPISCHRSVAPRSRRPRHRNVAPRSQRLLRQKVAISIIGKDSTGSTKKILWLRESPMLTKYVHPDPSHP